MKNLRKPNLLKLQWKTPEIQVENNKISENKKKIYNNENQVKWCVLFV